MALRTLHEKIAYTFVISSVLMHVFCCGLPLLLALANIAALSGITGMGVMHSPWFERMETSILVISGAMLLMTGVLQFISKRINCRKDGACVHEPCDKKKSLSEHLFKFAIVLYAANILLFALSH